MNRTMETDDLFNLYLEREQYVSGGKAAPNWTTDGAGFWYAANAPENTRIMRVDLENGEETELFDVAAVRSSLEHLTGHVPPHHGLPFETFTQLENGLVQFTYEGEVFRLDPDSSFVERLGDLGLLKGRGPMSESERMTPQMWSRGDYLIHRTPVPEQMSPDGAWFAGVRDENVVLRSTRDGRHVSLTRNGSATRFWDMESMRPRIKPGLQVSMEIKSPWSPNSLALVAYTRDISNVFQMPRMNWLKPDEEVEFVSYQKAGAPLDDVKAYILGVRGEEPVEIDLHTEGERYIQLLGWRPDSSEALLIVYERDFKTVRIVAANRLTGASRVILTERAETFVKVQHEAMYFGNHGFTLTPDGEGFIWASTRDGWNHLYLYNLDGDLEAQLTNGEWPVHDVEHIDDTHLYFTGAVDAARPYDVHVCRVPLRGGSVERLTSETGVHAPSFAPNGRAFLDIHSSVDRPVCSVLRRSDGTELRTVSEMDISNLERAGYRPAEEFTVKSADGETDLWGVMYTPADFDPSRKYPMLEYIYAGPQIITAPRHFSVEVVKTSNLVWALAQLGYVVVCLDARGTPGRSKAFQDAVYKAWAVNEIPDHAAAIRQLCERHPWLDADRVGIFGHSWGGYFSTCALMQAPETYHAAVSSAPGYDAWDAIIYEPYLDLPQRDRTPYDHASLYQYVRDIRGHLMIVAGTSDHGVITNANKMTRALIDAGVDHEFVTIPGAFHGFAEAEADYYIAKLVGWFDRHVKNRDVEVQS